MTDVQETKVTPEELEETALEIVRQILAVFGLRENEDDEDSGVHNIAVISNHSLMVIDVDLQDDVRGEVIGKSGRTLDALNLLLAAALSRRLSYRRYNRRVRVNIRGYLREHSGPDDRRGGRRQPPESRRGERAYD